MSRDIAVKPNGFIDLRGEADKDIRIKPESSEIHLMDTFVSDTLFLEDKSILETLHAGDTLMLRRVTDDADEYAVMLVDGNNEKVGYIPEKDAPVPANLLDAGKHLEARITKTEVYKGLNQISLSVFLRDY
ncbi:MAG: hypothetical protein IJ120_00650 [Solobacterium sp.]|nr:hypothetical protein [Solobacterium sp.]